MMEEKMTVVKDEKEKKMLSWLPEIWQLDMSTVGDRFRANQLFSFSFKS